MNPLAADVRSNAKSHENRRESMKSRSIPVLVLVLSLTAGAALAGSHMEPSPLRKLDPLVGKFQCSGTTYANPMAPEHATVATVETKWTLDGNWAMFTYAEKKTAANPKPFAISGFFGWNADKKQYVVIGADNMGVSGTAFASGWEGDSISFVGPASMGGMTMNGRDTFTRVGANQLTHMFEVEENGTWKKMSQETCRRQ